MEEGLEMEKSLEVLWNKAHLAKYCSHCGLIVNDTYYPVYCSGCGYKLRHNHLMPSSFTTNSIRCSMGFHDWLKKPIDYSTYPDLSQQKKCRRCGLKKTDTWWERL